MNTHTNNEYARRLARESIGKGYTINMQSLSVSVDDEKRIVTLSPNVESPTPQAAVQGDAVVEWLTELGFEFHDDPDEPFWMKLEYTKQSGFTVKVTPHTAAYFYQQIKPHPDVGAPTKSSGELEDKTLGKILGEIVGVTLVEQLKDYRWFINWRTLDERANWTADDFHQLNWPDDLGIIGVTCVDIVAAIKPKVNQLIDQQVATQTTKLQAEALRRILDEKNISEVYEWGKLHEYVKVSVIKSELAQLEREHKIGEDGE